MFPAVVPPLGFSCADLWDRRRRSAKVNRQLAMLTSAIAATEEAANKAPGELASNSENKDA